MKRLKTMLTTIVVLLYSISASAHDFEVDGIYYNITSSEDLTVEVTYKGSDQASATYSGNVVIPSSVEYNGIIYSVTSIGDYAFFLCSGLTNITIPNSVTSIGWHAFGGQPFGSHPNLTNVVIPNSVTNIGNYAFEYCTGLSNINIPSSVTSIGMYTFRGCVSLPVEDNVRYADNWVVGVTNSEQISYTLRDNTVGLCPGSFENCINMTNITIPNSVKYIGYLAFSGCCELTEIIIPESVISIEYNAFEECTSLTNITIPNSVTSIGYSVFKNCTRLTNVVIGNSVKSIGDGVFKGCASLTGITIPNSVTSIGNSVFSGCSRLTDVVIGNSVTSIGNETFKGCTDLTNITIPNSVTNIGNSVFSGCSGLTNVVIGNSVTKIGDRAFDGCTGLTSIIIPESITDLGDELSTSSVFPNCPQLVILTIESQTIANKRDLKYCFGEQVTKVILGDKITSIGNGAFSGCTNLMEINIPNSVIDIGSEAFSGCFSLTNITIPESMASIGSNAFNGCTGLTNITIPKSMTSIGGSAFYGCSNLTTVIIESQSIVSHVISCFGAKVTKYILGEEVTSIEDRAFDGCTSLTSIIIPNSVTSIGNSAFEGCTSLTSITIPNSVKSIGSYAFKGCASLTDIIIPDAVTGIGSSTFRGCTGLANIIISESVTNIEGDAFNGCSNLSTVTIKSQAVASKSFLSSCFGKQVKKYILGENVTSIGSETFKDCANLTEISIPASVTSVAKDAFSGCTNLPVENDVRYADTWAVGVTDNTKAKYTLRENTTGLGGTFSDCTNLARVSLPSGLKHISDYSFNGCSLLKSIEIPTTVVSIGERAFYGCSTLSTLDIPTAVESIGEYAFSYCEGLTSVVIPENVTNISDYIFCNCSNLVSIELPEKVTSIGTSAFSNCALKSITIPESVVTVGQSAFSGNSFTDVTINSSAIASQGMFSDMFGTYVNNYAIGAKIEKLEDMAFYNCTRLEAVTLPETLTEIGESSFEGCTGLTSIAIPANVATINDYAFAGCTNLSVVACDGITPPTCGAGTFEDVNTVECTIEVPEEAIDVYAETSPWSDFNILGVSTPNEVTLTDGQLFENEKEMMVDKITYTRTLNNTAWNALYVPFEIPVSQLIDDYEVAYINGIHSYDDDDNGEIDRMSMEVVKVKSGTLLANHPYLIKARTEEAKQMNITVNNTTLYAAKSTTLDCSSVYTKYEITGIYEKMADSQLAGCYALSGGSWKQLASGSYLNPFRLYLRITSRGNSPVKVSPLAMTRIGIHVQGEESSTSVEELLMQEQPKEEIIYDLLGRRVENPVKGHIYIVNGKKRVY